MPRTGGVYSEPAGTKAVPNTTIQSAPYNSFVDDLVQDANAARPITAGGTGATNATQARTNLGVAIGTNVQAYDALLQSIAGLTTSSNQMIYLTASNVAAVTTITAFGRSLIDDADAATARATLGTNDAANLTTGYLSPDRIKHYLADTADSGSVYITNGLDGSTLGRVGLSNAGNLIYSYNNVEVFRVGNNGVMGTVSIPASLITGLTVNDSNWSGADLAIANGGTGASTAPAARTNLGLGTAAVQNIGTSGANVPLMSTSNTWSASQVFLDIGVVGFTGSRGINIGPSSDNSSGRLFFNSLSASWSILAVDSDGSLRFSNGASYGTATGTNRMNLLANGDLVLGGTLGVSSGGTGATTPSGARTALGLGSLAIQNTVNNGDWSGTDLSVANGGTGASTAAAARTNLGLDTFESSALTPTLGGLVQAAHGLGALPPYYAAFLRCATAEAGWSVGDETPVNATTVSGTDGRGVQVYADATNVYARVGNSGLILFNKSTGAAASLTLANWRVILKARL